MHTYTHTQTQTQTQTHTHTHTNTMLKILNNFSDANSTSLFNVSPVFSRILITLEVML